MVKKKARAIWLVLISLVLTISVAGTVFAGGAKERKPAVMPSPGIFCGAVCQAALRLEADPADVKGMVGISWNSGLHEFGAATVVISEKAAKAFPNMVLIVTEAGGDAMRQTSQIEDLIARGVDVLIVSPADAAGIAPVIKEANKAGIAVISSDRTVAGEPVLCHIGSDNYEAGWVSGQHLVSRFGGGGRVVELQGTLGASPTIDRGNGFREAIRGSKVEIVASHAANYDQAKALSVMEDILVRYRPGEIDAVFTHNDGMAAGAIQALVEAGRIDEIMVFSIDGRDSAMEAIKAGRQACTVMYPLTAKEHILAAAKVLAGEKLPPKITLESTLITPGNVDRYLGTRLGVPAEELGL